MINATQAATILEFICRQARAWLRQEAEFFADFYLREEGRSLEIDSELCRTARAELAAHAKRFFLRFRAYLREAIVAGAMALVGPRPLSGSELGDIDRLAAVQEAFLSKFESDFISNPPVPMRPEKTTEIIALSEPMTISQFIARAEQYGNSPWAAGWEVNRAQTIRDGVYTMERRVLGAVDRHCDVCPGLASQGWVQIGTSVEIGNTPCDGSCRCHIEYK